MSQIRLKTCFLEKKQPEKLEKIKKIQIYFLFRILINRRLGIILEFIFEKKNLFEKKGQKELYSKK